MGAQGGKIAAGVGSGLGGWSGLARPWGGDAAQAARSALAAMLARETAERRLPLWLPIFFLAGVLAYFGAEREPGALAPCLALACAAVASVLAFRRGWILSGRALACGAFILAGFAACLLRVWIVDAPTIRAIRIAKVTAYIETLDDRANGARLLLRVIEVEGLAPEATPSRLRVGVRNAAGLEAGQTIRAAMRLIPPAEQSEPGGYDFAREAYFQFIGGVGSVVSRPERVEDARVSIVARVNAAIDRARNDLTRRIVAVIGGDNGAVAAALITGKRGLISDDANDALRGAGIYHVVSISGLHMVLAAGLFMWTLRVMFAAIPSIALRWPTKKIAAVFAMAGAGAYDVFAGSEVATERSLIMIVVMLGAVLFDRPALSMRNLAVAALIVMAREPESVMGPSFQMSFGAVAAMIALFERSPSREPRERADGFLARAGRALVIMLLTTFVAGLATGPYASFHFHRVNPYSIIGNSLTMPLVEFIVMPAALLGVVLGAFGLDAPVWTLMGWGVGGMMDLSRHVAALSGSTRYVESFGLGALLLISFGLLWMCLWRSGLRVLGLAPIVAGLWFAADWRPPDLAVDPSARAMAVRGLSGRFEILNGRGNDFAVSQWLLGDADSRRPGAPGLAGESRCDADLCLTRLVDGRTVALVFAPASLANACRRADILVTRLRVFRGCESVELVLDDRHFAAHGATELRLQGEGPLAMRTARSGRGVRPWQAPPRPDRFPPRLDEERRNPFDVWDEDADPRAFGAGG